MPAYNKIRFHSGINSASGFLVKAGPVLLQYVAIGDAVASNVKLYDAADLTSGVLVDSFTAGAAASVTRVYKAYLQNGLRVTSSGSTALTFIYQ